MKSLFKNATKEELSVELEKILEMPLLAPYKPHVIRMLKLKRLQRVSSKAMKSNLDRDYLTFVKVNNDLVNDGIIEGQIL